LATRRAHAANPHARPIEPADGKRVAHRTGPALGQAQIVLRIALRGGMTFDRGAADPHAGKLARQIAQHVALDRIDLAAVEGKQQAIVDAQQIASSDLLEAMLFQNRALGRRESGVRHHLA
jgi:hypothetical protein